MTIRQLAEAIALGWDGLVDVMAAEFQASVGAPRVDEVDLRDTVGLIGRVFVDCIDGKMPPVETLARLRSVGSELARQGVELGDLVDALRSAVTEGVRRLRGLAASFKEVTPDERNELDEAIALGAVHSASLIQTEFSGGWTEGRGDKLADEARKAVSFVDRVLRGSARELESAAGALTELGVASSTSWHLIIVGSTDRGDADLIREAAHAVAGLGTRDIPIIEGPLRHQPVPHGVLLAHKDFAKLDPSGVERALGDRDLAIAVSPAPLLLDSISGGHAETLDALKVFAAATWGSRWVTTAELMWWGLRACVPEVKRLQSFDSAIGAVLTDVRCGELLAILDVLASGMKLSLKQAASLLGYDEKTIRRHLDRIESLTGLRWSDDGARRVISDAIAFRLIAAHYQFDYDDADWGPRPAPRERNWRFTR